MFEGKTICSGCQTPQGPEGFREGSDVCTACQAKYERQLEVNGALAEVDRGEQKEDVLLASLQKLRNKSAATPSIAEGFLDAAGGGEAIGRKLHEDFARVRGDNLTAEQRQAHTVPENTLATYYKLMTEISSKRDQMVMDADPLQEIESDQLTAMIAEGAFIRVKDDANFRMELLAAIVEAEPRIVERMVEPSVEVKNA